jgi:intracellular multiplication protein IcmO
MRRGLEQHQEQDPSLLIRDTRTLGQKARDFLKEPLYSAAMFFVLAVSCVFFPSIADVLVVIGVLLSFYCITVARKAKLPFRMPMRSKATDYNDLSPGSNKPNTARGICFLGNEEKTNEELWFNNEDMRTHVLIFGSTGAGKTEALVSMAYNALLQGSGFIYVDGKGDNSLYAKVFAMCRRLGREDDLLLVNFMTGARDVIGAQESKLSNTMNPFATGSSSMLIALVVSLMGDSQGGAPDADMWKNRAINFVEALMKTLVYMRDEGKIRLDANVIRQYFHLNMLEQIAIDKQFPREGQESVSLAEAPALVMEPIYNYLMNLPGFDFKKKGKQVSQTLEQHGFITMQLTRVFGSLADTYSHIIRTNIPEVDMHDVVLNRRILVVLLPALEKSPDELSNLGKIIVATLRAMMASGLGDSVEGSYKDVILTKPTNAKTPYMCILDEYGYYAVKGFAVVPAQARSLGFSTIFAGQDLPAFQKASKEEAASIGANTNIKICMKLEDPTETWEFFQKTAGESYVTKVDHFQTDQGSMMNNYMDTRSASAEKRGRVDLLDLKDQGMGEAHIFFKSGIIRAKMFYANPKPVKYMRLNHFLKVDKPTTKVLLDFEAQLDGFGFIAKENPLFGMEPEAIDEVETIRRIFDEKQEESAIEKSVAAFLACCDTGEESPAAESTTSLSGIAQTETPSGEPEVVDISDRLNVFVKVKAVPLVEELIPQERLSDFTANLLSKKNVRDKVELIERLMGKKSNQASNIAWEVVRDMESATDYPPPIRVNLSATELTDITNKLINYVKTSGKK